jgi:hypothetical protein
LCVNGIYELEAEVADDSNQIIEQVETYIRQGGGRYEDWYVGLADNPIKPVSEAFSLHKVQSRRFTYIETPSARVARDVARHFVNLRGTDGNLSTNKISHTCNSVYVYKKAGYPVDVIK